MLLNTRNAFNMLMDEYSDYSSTSFAAERIWLGIVHRYSEPHRYYHTLSHVEDICRKIEQSWDTRTLPRDQKAALHLAALFHDIIYNPRREDNETKSNSMMMATAQVIRIPTSLIDQASDYILQTTTNEPSIFTALNRSILGAEFLEYQKYSQYIRREFHFVKEEVYSEQRIKVLEKLQKTLSDNWVLAGFSYDRAMQNIKNEIKQLGG
jgi:predicted metal-dependent HD superfamily phosphohydrolase